MCLSSDCSSSKVYVLYLVLVPYGWFKCLSDQHTEFVSMSAALDIIRVNSVTPLGIDRKALLLGFGSPELDVSQCDLLESLTAL